MTFLFKNKQYIHSNDKDYYGFIYLITDENGKKYLGKKAFSHSVKQKLSKKKKTELNTKKRFERVKKDSSWENYYGSNKELLEKIKNGEIDKSKIKREILCFCKTRIDLTYWECFYLFKYNVLFDNNFYNGNILSKFFKGKINMYE